MTKPIKDPVQVYISAKQIKEMWPFTEIHLRN